MKRAILDPLRFQKGTNPRQVGRLSCCHSLITTIRRASLFLVAKSFLVLVMLGLLASSAALAAESSQTWEQVLAAARKEGKVSVIGPQGTETRDALSLAFQKKYPDIKVELQSMSGSQVGPRLIAELAAGRNSTDVLVLGTTTVLEALLPAKAVVPVKPWLSGPNTQDPSKWRGGKLTFSDEAQSYNLVFSQYVKAPFIYNSQLVSAADFKSYKDLLDPKWQGKIALRDPTIAGGSMGTATLWYIHADLGKDFMRKLFALKDLAIPRDDRQILDFCARGKYTIAIGPSDVLTNQFIERGLPLRHLKPETLKEGSYITTGNGSMAIPRSAPHPNALRVYADFLLSPEGQLAWSKAAGFASLRRDVSKDHVLDVLVPKEGTPYVDLSAEKYISSRVEVVEFMKTIMPR